MNWIKTSAKSVIITPIVLITNLFFGHDVIVTGMNLKKNLPDTGLNEYLQLEKA